MASMTLESDGRKVSNSQLLLRGLAFLVVVGLAAAALIAKSDGTFEKTIEVTAELGSVGDGLPRKSDVKYLGVLVGFVDSVSAGVDGGPNVVHIDLLPDSADGIPDTVTARVVPSNVFAVPSIQLVDNGPGVPLAGGARIREDRSLATVRLQTSLTALDRITAAVGRPATDPTLGLLTIIELASSGRGAEALRAAAQLRQIVAAMNQAIPDNGNAATLAALSDAIDGLRTSTPELLAALHDAVVPMRAVAAERTQIAELLTGGLDTSGTVATALQHKTATITGITGKISPALDVLARGGRNFVQMTTSLTVLGHKFGALWDPQTQNLTAKIIVELTPHKQYTRADCPRYGTLAGPSCSTAPPGGPAILDTGGTGVDREADLLGGNVGPVGSRQEQGRIASIFGGRPNPAADLLVGPLVRDSDVAVVAPTGAR